jgi:hypothetical protein
MTFTGLQEIISQMTELFIATAVRTSNPANQEMAVKDSPEQFFITNTNEERNQYYRLTQNFDSAQKSAVTHL